MSDLEAAHDKCKRHRDIVEKSTACGCFYCGQRFPPSSIREWCDGGSTAVCPRCGIDSVIPDAAGLPLTDSFLVSMHERWFARGVDAAGRPVVINVRGWAASAIALNEQFAAVTAERDKLRAELDEAALLLRRSAPLLSFAMDRLGEFPTEEYPGLLLADIRAFLARTEPKGGQRT